MTRLLLILLLVTFSTMSVADKSRDVVFGLLLISDNASDNKLAAKDLYHLPPENSELLDLAAWVLMNSATDYNDEEEDTLAWLAKALGASKQARYRDVLIELKSKTSSKKLKRYIKGALKEIGDTQGDGFDLENYDVDKVSKELMALASKAQVSKMGFLQINVGSSLEDVLNKLGEPNSVGQYVRSSYRPFLGNLRLQNLRITYLNAGSMEFSLNSNVWVLKNAFTQSKVDTANLAPAELALVSQLLSSDYNLVRKSAREAIATKLTNPAALDQVAQRVWQLRDIDDKGMGDAMAWLCKVLAASGNGRYHDVLNKLYEQAGNKKIVKYAKSSKKKLTPTEPSFQVQ
ncbi:hypothetical protein HWQ46_21295 [Shewanella sp. D64]|uniref:hypothetical protein n=1 Tax=unclassified Shewanella TaxID=196818 RepID=UPI0022BA576C|nr:MULTISPECIES: hypothetical protein [unclassified Shewanella]MEC4728075.1 hypothetical protein [Shewanella sp. D64]MEC4738167.1 hypothetical protein [Shewanella sp. E94]WBJ96321.1 hypothetical protein HWQ47_04135 [Shewanella sp. MTB7]